MKFKFKYKFCFANILFSLVLLLIFINQVFAAGMAPDKEWWTAIRNDSASTVQSYLLKNVDISAYNDIGNPALIQSVREQSWKVYDVLLLAPGIDVDQANRLNETALMYLSILGQTDRAAALIQAGAAVNRLGWTPLHYAASRGQIKTAQMLIDQGAIINAPGPDGTSPLMMAALSGNQTMVRLLMDHGADSTMINIDKETAADWARRGKHNSLARLLDDVAGRVHARRAGIDEPAAVAEPEQTTADSDDNGTARYFDLSRFD